MIEEKIFTYSFLVESEKDEQDEGERSRKWTTDRCSIRIYGLDQHNKTVCVKVKDFKPYCYIELQKMRMGRWTETLLQPVKELFCSFVGRNKPLSIELVYKNRLYDNETETYPFLKCIFRVKRDLYILRKEIQKRAVEGVHELWVGDSIKKLKFRFHETKAGEILQLVCERDLPTAGWIKFRGFAESEKETLADREYTISRMDLHKCESGKEPCASVAPLVMSFDIEAYSHNPLKFPDAEHPEDKVFMISCVFFRAGNDEIVREVLLTLGNPDEGVVGCECIPYKTESGLLEGFTDVLHDMNPHIITGYNIMSFDMDYMIKRSITEYCEANFQAGGMHKNRLAEKKTMKWSSSAYKNQEFSYLNYEGRIFIDLLPVIRRDYNKLRNYKLSTVSQHFIDSDKEDLPVKELFECYRVGVLEEVKNPKFASMELGRAGKYCMVDSRLVAKLFNKLNIWYGASEMAKTCNVPIFDLSTRGQQIRVYSQVYKHCLREKIVVQENGYVAKEGERYVGAYVFQPKAGAYNNIVPFDFASLYPTIIIAYNIDFSTLVTNPRVPDRHCHVIEWADHLGCEHDKNVIRVKEITSFIDQTVENLKKMRKTRDRLKLKDFYPLGTKKATKEVKARAQILREKRRKQMNREIKEREKKLKPYREERADVKKSIPKRVMCGKRRYRFLKSPKGVIPTILQNMLDARANTRKVIKENKKVLKEMGESDGSVRERNDLDMTNKILDQRQLAYKVCCNSMYGAMGVREGYLPFMPGAMCTTAMGRRNNILAANTIVEKWKGKLVYGDTDSEYLFFPHLQDDSKSRSENATTLWNYCETVAKDVTKLYPSPMKLEFEEEIYHRFIILSKKRYMYREMDKQGKLKDKVGNKGVLLTRRDNSDVVRDIYKGVADMFFKRESDEMVMQWIFGKVLDMFRGKLELENFVITKATGSVGNLPMVCEAGTGTSVQWLKNLENNPNPEVAKGKVKIGNYVIPMLPKGLTDESLKERNRLLMLKEARNAIEYYTHSLPAHVSLAMKMKTRGIRVDDGTRLEHVVVRCWKKTDKLFLKLEDVNYVRKHSRYVKIDYMYYLKSMVNPLDQMLNACFNHKENRNFMLRVYSHFIKRQKIMHTFTQTRKINFQSGEPICLRPRMSNEEK